LIGFELHGNSVANGFKKVKFGFLYKGIK